VKDFDLLHGLLLARIARAAPGSSLLLAEVLPEEGWTGLQVAGGLGVVIRHRQLPRMLRRKDGGASGRFPFSAEQLERLGRLGGTMPVALALVCGRKAAPRSEVCLLAPAEVGQALDTGSFLAQGLTVLALPRKELWVTSRGRTRLKVPRRSVAEWLQAGHAGRQIRGRRTGSSPAAGS
jgi:hypothetical protein